mgnify:CR=1 FL=1
METLMSNSELYYMLVEKGYSIDITEEKNSKVIRFNGKHTTKESKEKVQAWYSKDWTDDEIKRDIAAKLLTWSGLKLKTVLDY